MFPIKDDQPRYSTPYVNGFLIGINILIYLFQFLHLLQDPRGADAFMRQYAEIPAHLAAYLGGSHRWFLYIFGDNVEDYLGHFKYLIFYLLSGLIAMGTQVAIYPHSNVPTVGASGAIAGVLGAYFLLYPRARVLTWFFVFVLYIPAWIVLGEWFVLQFWQGAATLSMTQAGKDVGGVAVWAHVGGFVAGMAMIKLFPERGRRSPYAYR
jgi:membrane associated rhomboid family serine protease